MTKFNVKFSDNTYRAVSELARETDGTMADVIREALSIYVWLAKEYRQGNKLLIQRGEQVTELLVPSLERMVGTQATGEETNAGVVDDTPLRSRQPRGPRAKTASDS
jgi:predicted transcriptional regulator